MSVYDEVSGYEAVYPEEKAFKESLLNFLSGTDNYLGKENEAGHITVSTFIINSEKTKVLLTHHKKLNKWLQLGGHTEVGETILETGLREAREESGLETMKCLPGIFDMDVHTIPFNGRTQEHLHYDIRLLVEADDKEELIISNESKDLKWVEVSNITEYSNDRSILRMCKKIGLKD